MPAPRPRRRAVAAWLVTGPLGHLAGGVTDWVELLARYAWKRFQESGFRSGRPGR